jgi:tetratricopeptide (TPR) repeat protein
LCLLLIGGSGYLICYPQIRAAWLWRQARHSIDRGDLGLAQEQLQYCLTVWPSSGETHFLLARTARRAGDSSTARTHLKEASRLDWVKEQIRLEYLLIDAQAGGVPRVESQLRALLAEGSADEPLIFEALVRGCLQGNFVKDAYRWSDLWTERHADDWRAHFWHGVVLEAGLQKDLAMAQYQTALDSNPDYPDAHLRLGELLLVSRRYPEARAHYQFVLQKDAEHAGALLGLAHCQRAAGQLAEARVTLDHLLSSAPNNAVALLLRGQVELDAIDASAALPVLRRAETLNPRDRLTLEPLVTALRLLNQEEEARKYDDTLAQIDKDQKRLEEVVKEALEKPADVSLRTEAGNLCLRLGRPQDALRWLASALMIDRDYPPAKLALSECLQKLGDPALLEYYRSLISPSPP